MLVPVLQCGGCVDELTELSEDPCLENRTYCEAGTEVSQVERQLNETLTESCEWADILLAARRLFRAALETWQKATETWEEAKKTLTNPIQHLTAYEHAKQAWENAQDTWALEQGTWEHAIETADAAKDLCGKTWEGLKALYPKLKSWLSRCLG